MAASFEEMIKNSYCFGLAYDSSVKECKVCEVHLKCEAKCRLGQATKPTPVKVATPAEVNTKDVVKQTESVPVVSTNKPSKKGKKATTPAKLPKKKETEKPPVTYASDMPSFRNISMEDLENLAKTRGCDMEALAKYTVPQIRRMRLTMAIKKTYVLP